MAAEPVMAECAVIIPYFQTDGEVFRKALASVFAQSYTNFIVIVVDDASPLPAEEALIGLDDVSRARITVIRQANEGPGGARNTGLANLPDGIAFVAFLDSDDLWHPEHLERSISRMKALGADCSWSLISATDDFDPYYPVNAVEEQDLIRPAEGYETAYFIQDLPRFLLYKWWHYLHLSTLVLTRRVFEPTRFRPYFRVAGEDLMFFYDCGKSARALLVSTEVGATRGTGQNFYFGAEFATPKVVRQMFYSIRAIQILGRENRYTGTDAVMLESWLRETREHALRNMTSGLLRRRWGVIPPMMNWLRLDPRLVPASFRMGKRLWEERRPFSFSKPRS